MYHLLTEEFHGFPISFRKESAWVNLTQMCAAFKKEPFDFLRIDPTQAYIKALAENLGLFRSGTATNPSLFRSTPGTKPDSNCVPGTQLEGLVETEKARGRAGTWAHPDLAMECARWLSPELSVRCNQIIRRLLSGEIIADVALAPDQQRLRRQQLRFQRMELQNELKKVRRQFDEMRAAEAPDGHVSVGDWIAQQGFTLPEGAASKLGIRLARDARQGIITSGAKTVPVDNKSRCARKAAYAPEAIASTFAALFPKKLTAVPV